MASVLIRAFVLLALSTVAMSVTGGAPLGSASAQEVNEDRPVENISIVDQKWSRGAGLLIAEVTLSNVNHFPVVHVIVACDFVKRGTQIGSRGSLVPRIISPGTTTVGGIEFGILERDMEGGPCRILSAQRLWTDGPATNSQ